MNQPLVRARRTIEGRLRLLEQKLNGELGFRDQRLRFLKRAMRNGPTTWILRNEQADAAGIVVPQGSAAELAPAGNDESILYFGYSEEWQPARARDHVEFVSSNLRFVIAGVEEMPDVRFRLEWAGAKTERGAVSYPGAGAAHPHWQFDLDSGWLDQVQLGDVTPEGAIEIDLEPSIEEVELEEATVDNASVEQRMSATLAGFHRSHDVARHDLRHAGCRHTSTTHTGFRRGN